MILIIGGKYQGKHDYAAEHFKGLNTYDFEELLKNCGVQAFIEKMNYSEDSGKTVVIADENASGIVPDNMEEIRFREEYNRKLLLLSGEADEVHRVFCGIGMRIK